MEGADSSARRILILTSHGIRTNARWQKKLEEIVLAEVNERNEAVAKGSSAPGAQRLQVTFRHNDYRYFSIFSFLNPFRRRSETHKFEARLRDYIASDTFDDINLVGHSFGTHIIGRSLLAIGPSLNGKVGTVILAASVLPGSFPWDALFKTGIRRLVNECGDSDLVLVFNAVLPFGSGLAGRRGFAGITGDHFRNRFFRFGHSGYFKKRLPDGIDDVWFMRKYWVPLLLGENTTPFVDEREDGYSRLFLGWLVDQSENLKWMIPVGLASVLALAFLYLALVWRTNFNLETLDIAGQVTDAVERGQLHGMAEKIGTRQAAIEKVANGPMTMLESLVRRDAKASFNPSQWERARTAAKLVIRPKKLLTTDEVAEVRLRGSNFAQITFSDKQPDDISTGDDPRERRPTVATFDLRTGKRSESAMWQWSGPYASSGNIIPRDEYGSARVQPVGALGLQGRLEHQFSTSLSPDGLTLWNIASATPRSSWKPERWGAVPLVDAKPCGQAGDAVALTQGGKAFVLRADGTTIELASPAPLVHVIADRSCARFAAATNGLALVAWTDPARYLNLLPDLTVHSIEFSAAQDLLLVNSTHKGDSEEERADLIAFPEHGANPVEWFGALDVDIAAFSPSGRQVAMKDGEACSILQTDILAAGAADSPSPFDITCPKDVSDARSLAHHVRFLDNDKLVLTTRADLGSFGDSHLEVLDLSARRSQWLARGSRYDIISLDASSDGSVITTTSGDSADEGYGADRGFYVWSTYSHMPVFEDTRGQASGWEARRAWLTPDGTRAIVAWRRFVPETSASVLETEVVDLDPDKLAALGVDRDAAVAPSVWGVDLGDLDIEQRPCRGVPDNAEWADESSDEAVKWINTGCVAQGAFLLRAAVAGKPAQLRFFQDGGSWKIRIREAAAGSVKSISYIDGSLVADDIRNFVSDPLAHRVFVSHGSGKITRLDLAGDMTATVLREETGEENDVWLNWVGTRQWLRVEAYDAQTDGGKSGGIRFYDVDGRLMRHYGEVAKWGIAYATSGAFDQNDHYWTIVEQTVGQQLVEVDADSGTEPETKTQRLLVNLDTGETLSFGCDGEAYLGSSNIHDPLPTLKVSRSGRFLGAGNLAPTIGAAQNNTEMRLFDLVEKKCLGLFRHGGEIYDFGISDDGRLLATRGLNELHLWHVPTQTVVRTFFGPTRVVDDALGLRVLTRADSDHPAVWPIPGDLAKWL